MIFTILISIVFIAEVIIAKHRGGSTGTVKLVWMGEYTKFANLAKGYEEY